MTLIKFTAMSCSLDVCEMEPSAAVSIQIPDKTRDPNIYTVEIQTRAILVRISERQSRILQCKDYRHLPMHRDPPVSNLTALSFSLLADHRYCYLQGIV